MNEDLKELIALFQCMTDDQKAEFIQYARLLFEQEQRESE